MGEADQELAVDQAKVFTSRIARIDMIFETLKNTPYDDQRSMLDVTTIMVSSELSRTLRAEGPSENTGTNHNPLSNSILIGGKGIRGGLVIGETDMENSTVVLSEAHISVDPDKSKLV